MIVRNDVSSYKQGKKSTTDTVNVSVFRERMMNHTVTLYWVWYLSHNQLSASPYHGGISIGMECSI